MENMELKNLFGGIYYDKTVLITGHTGFKGSWLAFWLHQMGAKVVGFALPPVHTPAHLDLLNLPIENVYENILNQSALHSAFQKYQPEIVFHLAAQAIVLDSYQDPVLTYATNVLGSLHVYEAARKCKNTKAIVSVTTDKVYENKEWHWGYRENDRLGGFDPYSSSKACVEIMTESYRKSFMNNSNILLATARSGNVIGGGDWANHRLIPDIIKAIQNKQTVVIRNPSAVRPWQHVLEPLAGYLLLGKKLLENKKEFAEAFNFAPDTNQNIEVIQTLGILQKNWNKVAFNISDETQKLHEASILKLDNSKSINILKWRPVWNIEETLRLTIDWYREYLDNQNVITYEQLVKYIQNEQAPVN